MLYSSVPPLKKPSWPRIIYQLPTCREARAIEINYIDNKGYFCTHYRNLPFPLRSPEKSQHNISPIVINYFLAVFTDFSAEVVVDIHLSIHSSIYPFIYPSIFHTAYNTIVSLELVQATEGSEDGIRPSWLPLPIYGWFWGCMRKPELQWRKYANCKSPEVGIKPRSWSDKVTALPTELPFCPGLYGNHLIFCTYIKIQMD